jgi:two-component system phosphate regulon response regulator PhoB
MPSTKILLIEDDPSISEVINYNLRQADYQVLICHDGREGLETAQRELPDLVILDLMLPSMDGIEICRRLRSNSSTRDVLILILSAKAEENDQVVGFAVNADDYVTKPFSVKVLLERIRVLLRRREAPPGERDMSSRHGITVDRMRHIATAGGHPIDLTPTEFSLLDVFIRQPGRAFTRSDLIDAAIGVDTVVLDRTIDVHIRSLRKKLGDYAQLIETVRGVGYRLRDE